MMTAQSIPVSSAGGYAAYLESRTVAPEQGDYYLGADGSPAEAPGRWITDPAALQALGVTSTDDVTPEDLRALMEGRRPDSPADGEPVWLRPPGSDGSRAGGIDVTFSAPKSVSIVWALATAPHRLQVEAAHRTAVRAALAHLRDTVPTTTSWSKEKRANIPAIAADLHAAEFLHTTARGVAGEVPDPQLHSHVVITSVQRTDGAVAAVRSRPVLRGAREVGAYYRAALADELRGLGYSIEPAGNDERYFRISGVPADLERTLSKRTEEVHVAAQRFRAEHGREPERGELRSLAVRSRNAKLPQTRGELDRAWERSADAHGLTRADVDHLQEQVPAAEQAGIWRAEVEPRLTKTSAIFDQRILRTTALEQAAAAALSPERALALADELIADRAVLPLADGRLTTARMRRLETDIQTRVERLAATPAAERAGAEVATAIAAVEERLGAPLNAEQRAAIECLSSERVGVLVGPAGTGKGAVIDALAQSELAANRQVVGVAVAGRTSQQLGEASPALAEHVRTLDSLVASVERGSTTIDTQTTVFVDEAGMGDTERLDKLTRAVEERGARMILVGDHRQLPSVGAGGMFARLQRVAPTCELHDVVRTSEPGERDAWAALRAGEPAQAMAHYRDRGRLHFSETRVEAVDTAARRYDELARDRDHDRVALMTDASNAEVDALNLRVQALRLRRGELSDPIEKPDSVELLYRGDRVCWTAAMPAFDGPRVENGVRGEIVATDEGSATVRLDGSGRTVEASGEDLALLRLGYASHVYRQQGATVDRAVVVTGGWQTSRETSYVEASRAREGAEWHVAREELDGDVDAERIDRLAARMRISRTQVPSIALPVAPNAAAPTPAVEPAPAPPAVEI
jgi:conjugative relaxase-like TrwC/TraI family protein